MILFINKEVEAEFNDPRFNATTRAMMLEAAHYTYSKYQEPLYVTSIYRPQNPESVHCYWRGGDADNDAGLSAIEKQDVCDYINSKFTYDSARPEKRACLYHTVEGRGGDHLHFQSHGNTTINGGTMNIVGKTILSSKTFWVNLLAIIFFIVQSFTSYVVPVEAQGYILAAINFVLRLVTKEPIVWKGVPNADG